MRLKFKVSSAKLSVLLALFLVVFHNNSFWRALLKVFDATWSEHIAFLVAVFVALVVFLNLMFTLLSGRYLLKPVAMLIVIAASFASHFMDSYGVLIDRDMMLNLAQTGLGEVLELVNFKMIVKVILLGFLPAGLIFYTDIDRSLGVKRFVRLKVVLISLLIMASIAGIFFQEFASVVRNERHLRWLITPINFTYAIGSLTKRALTSGPVVVRAIDAHGRERREGEKKRLVVLIVGETARAKNFSVNGYSRNTNPVLSTEEIISYTNVSSCGTATTTSVPCMFSKFTRDNYSHEKGRSNENLVDALTHAGVKVLWRENNSDCKGVCNRIETDVFVDRDTHECANLDFARFCPSGEGYDILLLHKLNEFVSGLKADSLIVLHQKGSHGPAYYLRYPKEFNIFFPVCETSQLQDCNSSEIINGYDNTIRYTDYFIGQTIDFLKQNSRQFDTAMIYVSDHGESLGENNIYLHGLPYMIAPKEQTHIPMILWMSKGFGKTGFKENCLEEKKNKPLSHDNIFHSVLGLMDVQAGDYLPELDFFASCRLKK
jgi:lipid A ethanolaminephosphotransferase